MEIRATFLDATNLFLARPVVVIRDIIDPAPDFSERIEKLSQFLMAENDPVFRDRRDGSENPNVAISNLALQLQDAAGIPKMAVIYKQSRESPNEVGFEYLFLEFKIQSDGFNRHQA